MHTFYAKFPEWWPLLSAPEDYEEEAGIYSDLLSAGVRRAH